MLCCVAAPRTNRIAVDQDPLGIPGNMKYDSCGAANRADPLAPFKSQIRGSTNRKANRMAQVFGDDHSPEDNGDPLGPCDCLFCICFLLQPACHL